MHNLKFMQSINAILNTKFLFVHFKCEYNKYEQIFVNRKKNSIFSPNPNCYNFSLPQAR